jgi:diketogulonate reductase-like aldo/keto reductase
LTFASLAASATALSAVPSTTLSNGVELPMLGLGVWQYTPDVANSASNAAFDVGFRSFDTAHDCESKRQPRVAPAHADNAAPPHTHTTDNNQDGIGKFIAGRLANGTKREQLFITSKVPGCGIQGVGKDKKCVADTQSFFEADLQLMGVAQADLMLIHFPPSGGCGALGCKSIQAQWKVFEDMYAAGKARAIGVSNYCESCLKCLFETMTVKPMVNQVKLHVGMGVDPTGLVSYCAAQNITVQAYSPLGDGSDDLITGPLVSGIAKAHGKASGATVSLKWLNQNGIPIVTKASDPTYLAEDFDLFGWQLTDAEMDQLNKATSPSGAPSFSCSS